jgi:hypothetical protein
MEACLERWEDEGAEDAVDFFNQSGRGREGSKHRGTYEASTFGCWFHTKEIDIGRRSFVGDNVDRLC